MMMALMASGLNGQNFAFNGYIPIEQPERTRKLRDLEPFIMSGVPPEEIAHKDAKGRSRVVRMSDGKGGWRVLAIGLGMDNESTFKMPDGRDGSFKGGEFSCAILRD